MNFHKAYTPSHTGVIRTRPEDFQVDEISSFIPCGEGEHLWLKIRKTGANTDWVAGQLAKLLDVKRQDVGFAGLKDRHAVTTQWFSVYLPGKDVPDLRTMLPESLADAVEILEQTRHQKKLRRGALEGNRFTIVVRECMGDNDLLAQTIEQVRKRGVPNYFGEQRFGNNNSNVERVRGWFKGELKPKNRNQRSMYLSAARSWIFNHILSERVGNDTWDKRIPGDVFILDGTHSWFADDGNEELVSRLERFDIHPSGVLWGRGRLESCDKTGEIEEKIAEGFAELCEGLQKHGLKQERRALRVKVADLEYEWLDKTSLKLEFSLPAGAYATVVLEQFLRF